MRRPGDSEAGATASDTTRALDAMPAHLAELPPMPLGYTSDYKPPAHDDLLWNDRQDFGELVGGIVALAVFVVLTVLIIGLSALLGT